MDNLRGNVVTQTSDKPFWGNLSSSSGSTPRYAIHKPNQTMAKVSRGGRMTAAKTRAAKTRGGKGPIKKRPAGRNIMKT